MSRPLRPGKFFTWDELTRTSRPIPNEIPNDEVAANLVRLCSVILDPLREAVGQPLIVTSGFRCAAVNAAVGGSSSSAHVLGLAADLKCAGLTSLQLAQVLVSIGVKFDQAIHYDRSRGGQLHVGLPLPGRVYRQQVLHAAGNSSGYATSALAAK